MSVWGGCTYRPNSRVPDGRQERAPDESLASGFRKVIPPKRWAFTFAHGGSPESNTPALPVDTFVVTLQVHLARSIHTTSSKRSKCGNWNSPSSNASSASENRCNVRARSFARLSTRFFSEELTCTISKALFAANDVEFNFALGDAEAGEVDASSTSSFDSPLKQNVPCLKRRTL